MEKKLWYDYSFKSLVDKKDISKTELFSRSNKNKIDVDLNLSNYATKSDLKM